MSRIELIKGSDLKLKLKKKGILQQDIVKKFGYNANTVSRYLSETNPMQMPASFVINVAIMAKLNLSDLIQGYNDPYIITDMRDKEVAAEPQVPYIAAPIQKELPPPPPQEIHKSDLVTIDVSRLTDIIDKLRTQLENVEQTVMDLKEGKFSVNQ
jgi:transcriptional regulator with XRE-family HTH domain